MTKSQCKTTKNDSCTMRSNNYIFTSKCRW